MMKELVLMLVAILNATSTSSKYLLVQLEDTSEEGIEGPLDEVAGDDGAIEPSDMYTTGTKQQASKHEVNRFNQIYTQSYFLIATYNKLSHGVLFLFPSFWKIRS